MITLCHRGALKEPGDRLWALRILSADRRSVAVPLSPTPIRQNRRDAAACPPCYAVVSLLAPPPNFTSLHTGGVASALPELRMRSLVLACFSLVSVGCNAVNAAPEVSGQWIVKQERDFRGNPGVPYECTFKQQRGELTVKCGTDPKAGEFKGQVRGRTMTWKLAKDIFDGVATDRIVATYSADLEESGTRANGIWTLTSSILNERGSFVAHRKGE
jgi:hypothetical protein